MQQVKYLELFQGHVPKDIIVKISRVEYIYIYIYIFIYIIYIWRDFNSVLLQDLSLMLESAVRDKI